MLSRRIRLTLASDYGVHHLDEMEVYMEELEEERKGAGGIISVHQLELHPWLARPDIVQWCRKRGIVLEGQFISRKICRFIEKQEEGLSGLKDLSYIPFTPGTLTPPLPPHILVQN